MSELPPDLHAMSTIEKVNLVCLLLRSLAPEGMLVREELLMDLESRVTSGDLNPVGMVPWETMRPQWMHSLRVRPSSTMSS